MSADEAIHDLLNFSTDTRSVAVLDAAGEVVAAAPAAAYAALAAAATGLWGAAEAGAAGTGESALDYVVIQDPEYAVVMLREGEHRIVALTAPKPAVGLLLFDLRTCLSDAYPQEDTR
jgi:predicted regulator of Ras-like GTPase activity (Roadblock/LC7/MglB family)